MHQVYPYDGEQSIPGNDEWPQEFMHRLSPNETDAEKCCQALEVLCFSHYETYTLGDNR